MVEKIIFLNTAWMKFYVGRHDEDIPVNGGSWITDNKNGGEVYNFEDYNGKCYGYFMHSGKNALEKHFNDVRSTDLFVDNVLVIWVATNLNKETRIVGWYKNARLFRTMQEQIAFTNSNYNFYYSVVADAEDCYLIPEEERNFNIERSAQAGTGTGMGRANIWYAESDFARKILIPKVIEWIDNYHGEYANIIYEKDVKGTILPEHEKIKDSQKIYTIALDYYNNDDFYSALGYMNFARKINETPELLYYLANTLFNLKRFNKALEIYKRLLSLDYDKKEVLYRIIFCYDVKADREKTLEYAYRILSFIEDSTEGMSEKIEIYRIIFNIYAYMDDLDAAERTVNELSSQTYGDESKRMLNEMRKFLKDLTAKA